MVVEPKQDRPRWTADRNQRRERCTKKKTERERQTKSVAPFPF